MWHIYVHQYSKADNKGWLLSVVQWLLSVIIAIKKGIQKERLTIGIASFSSLVIYRSWCSPTFAYCTWCSCSRILSSEKVPRYQRCPVLVSSRSRQNAHPAKGITDSQVLCTPWRAGTFSSRVRWVTVSAAAGREQLVRHTVHSAINQLIITVCWNTSCTTQNKITSCVVDWLAH